MKIIGLLLVTVFIIYGFNSYRQSPSSNDNLYNKLTDEERRVIINKGTERPHTGEYNHFEKKGTYLCKRCSTPLYRSTDKFLSSCGWPSFDDEIQGAIKRIPDRDGFRTEIVCNNCGAHLGHVFEGEGMTIKNLRHCVNSISLDFIPDLHENSKIQKAYFAGGCFWGMEYQFEKMDGVTDVVSGYMGGITKNPTYQDVSYKDTGHLEVVEVTYDSTKVSYEELVKRFFEIHDSTQTDGQGPDIGTQYLSAIFFRTLKEREIGERIIHLLETKYKIYPATTLRYAKEFYKAEGYHQDYYSKKNGVPYCHSYKKIFE